MRKRKLANSSTAAAAAAPTAITAGSTHGSSSASFGNSSHSRPAPFSADPEALETLANIDYSVKISLEDAKAGRAQRPVRVYADGVYDMFHSGHARQLMQAKMAFPNAYLIVGVCNDEDTYKMKGNTVMNEGERYEAVRHCRYADEVLRDAPWSYDYDFLAKHKIDFVAHDDIPYGAGSTDDVYKWIKDRNMFLATERTEGISTTDVIARIIIHYDMYVRRNLKRGLSRKELNISYMKEKELQVKETLDSMRNRLEQKKRDLMDKWERRSNNFVHGFVSIFGHQGSISHWVRDKRLAFARAISPDIEGRITDGSEHDGGTPRKRPRIPHQQQLDQQGHNSDEAIVSDDEADWDTLFPTYSPARGSSGGGGGASSGRSGNHNS